MTHPAPSPLASASDSLACFVPPLTTTSCPCSVFDHPLSVDKFRHLCRYFPHAHHGFDRKGQPIYIDCTGKLDVDTCLGAVTVEEVLQSHIIMMEFQNRILMAEASAAAGHTVHRMCNIVDMKGASMRLASRKAMDVFKGIAAVDQDNYPETMGATYVVNAPWVFTAVWKLVRVFLDDGVTAKVHILGEGEPTRKALREAVDPAQLPAFLGGTCRCPGGCVSGAECTSPDGLVASQRRILAYCSEYSRALAAREIDQHGTPLAAPAPAAPPPPPQQPVVVAAPAPAAPQQAKAPPPPPPAIPLAQTERQPPPPPQQQPAVVAAASVPVQSRASAANGVATADVDDKWADAREQAEKEYERQFAFRKPSDYPAYPEQQPLRMPPTPGAALRAAEAAAAAAHAAQEDARRAAEEAASARAALSAAKAEAIAAELEARAAAKVAMYATKQAELAARFASLV